MKKLFFVLLLGFISIPAMSANADSVLTFSRFLEKNSFILTFSGIFVFASMLLSIGALLMTWNRRGIRILAIALAFFVFAYLNPTILGLSSLKIGIMSLSLTLPIFLTSFLFYKKEARERKQELKEEGYDVEHPLRIYGSEWKSLFNEKENRRIVVDRRYRIKDCSWKA